MARPASECCAAMMRWGGVGWDGVRGRARERAPWSILVVVRRRSLYSAAAQSSWPMWVRVCGCCGPAPPCHHPTAPPPPRLSLCPGFDRWSSFVRLTYLDLIYFLRTSLSTHITHTYSKKPKLKRLYPYPYPHNIHTNSTCTQLLERRIPERHAPNNHTYFLNLKNEEISIIYNNEQARPSLEHLGCRCPLGSV